MNTVISTSMPNSDTTASSARWVLFPLLLALVVMVFVLELSIGAVHIPLADVVAALVGRDVSQSTWTPIVLQFRLPRAITALVCGAGLGACGLMLQTLFRNPLADPYVLGVVFGARLGVALLVVSTGVAGNALLVRYGLVGEIATAMASAAGTLAVLGVLWLVARRVSTVTLLVLGLMIGYLCVGLISVALHFVDETQGRAFKAWDDGSFAGVTLRQLPLLIPIILTGLAVALAMAKSLNALLLGEDYAASLGVPVERVRLMAFACLALLAGGVTAYCGPIAFIGLVVAHLSRLVFRTADHRVLMPAVLLMGGLVALTADLVTHLPWSRHVFHLNAVIGLVGAPIVIWALLSRRQTLQLDV